MSTAERYYIPNTRSRGKDHIIGGGPRYNQGGEGLLPVRGAEPGAISE